MANTYLDEMVMVYLTTRNDIPMSQLSKFNSTIVDHDVGWKDVNVVVCWDTFLSFVYLSYVHELPTK